MSPGAAALAASVLARKGLFRALGVHVFGVVDQLTRKVREVGAAVGQKRCAPKSAMVLVIVGTTGQDLPRITRANLQTAIGARSGVRVERVREV